MLGLDSLAFCERFYNDYGKLIKCLVSMSIESFLKLLPSVTRGGGGGGQSSCRTPGLMQKQDVASLQIVLDQILYA